MNTFPPREIVERLRLQYPAGCRVELVSMDDPYARLRPGDQGRWLPWMTSARYTLTGTTVPASEPPMARTSSAAYKQRVLRPRAGLPARPLAAKTSLKKEPW